MYKNKEIRIFLQKGIVYHGKYISEDETFIIILDRYGKEVRINKSNIQNLEIQDIDSGEYSSFITADKIKEDGLK